MMANGQNIAASALSEVRQSIMEILQRPRAMQFSDIQMPSLPLRLLEGSDFLHLLRMTNTAYVLGKIWVPSRYVSWAPFPPSRTDTVQQSRPKPPKPSAKRKRDLDDDHDRPLVSGRTIARPRPKTHEIRRQFKERYAVDLSQNVFIGLCAYLQTVVAKGYSVPVTAWDAFVSAYISFPHAQREIAEEQARLQQDSVPAYHVWFEQESHGHETHHRIMNTQVLEELSQECQYFFLRARLAYDVIVAQSTPLTAGRSDLASKAESNSDPTLEVHPPSRHQDRADLAAGGEASGLARSRFSGLKIDHGGRLVNLAGFPSGIGTPDVGKRTKHPWTPDEDAILIEYVMAAQEYGDVPPQQPFQELENLVGAHPLPVRWYLSDALTVPSASVAFVAISLRIPSEQSSSRAVEPTPTPTPTPSLTWPRPLGQCFSDQR